MWKNFGETWCVNGLGERNGNETTPVGDLRIHCNNLSNYNVSQSGANADLASEEHPLESRKLCPLTAIIGLTSGLLPLLGFRQTSLRPAIQPPAPAWGVSLQDKVPDTIDMAISFFFLARRTCRTGRLHYQDGTIVRV